MTTRVEVIPVADLAPAVEAEAARTAGFPARSPALLRAFSAAGADARLLRVLRGDDVVAHALLLETRLHDFGTWTGLGPPVLRQSANADETWAALVAAARERNVVSASWRDLTLTRLDDAALAAAQRACEGQGGRVTRSPFVSHRLDLGRSLDLLRGDLHRTHRKAVRLAKDTGVRAGRASAETFAEAYAPLSRATWARGALEGPAESYVARLVQEDGFVPYLAHDAAGAPVAGAVVSVGARGSVYLHGASLPHQPGASTLLHLRILEDLHARGIPAYDLGGDPAPGAQDDTPRTAGIRWFKARFGGEARTWERLHLQIDPEAYARARAAAMTARGRDG